MHAGKRYDGPAWSLDVPAPILELPEQKAKPACAEAPCVPPAQPRADATDGKRGMAQTTDPAMHLEQNSAMSISADFGKRCLRHHSVVGARSTDYSISIEFSSILPCIENERGENAINTNWESHR